MNNSISQHRGALNSYDENIDSKYGTSEAQETDVGKLQTELRDTKEKLWTISQKFSLLRKERDTLKKENKDLQEEIMMMQNNMREMIPGFSNTSSPFPMYNELLIMISDFLKCNCEDIFFDVLSLELTIEGVVYFFKETIKSAQYVISQYFEPAFDAIKKSICNNSLEGPLLSVLKKSYQNSWKKVFSQSVPSNFCETVAGKIQEKLQLGDGSSSTKKSIAEYMKKLIEIIFLCKIGEPELVFDSDVMGTKVQFNASKYESMDGFVKHKDTVIVILPSVHKDSIKGEQIVKARILPVNYEFS